MYIPVYIKCRNSRQTSLQIFFTTFYLFFIFVCVCDIREELCYFAMLNENLDFLFFFLGSSYKISGRQGKDSDVNGVYDIKPDFDEVQRPMYLKTEGEEKYYLSYSNGGWNIGSEAHTNDCFTYTESKSLNENAKWKFFSDGDGEWKEDAKVKIQGF